MFLHSLHEFFLENYAIVKGGNDILNDEVKEFFKGIRKSEYGFEALTDNKIESKNKFGESVVIDKASLEDIMYFCNLRGENA